MEKKNKKEIKENNKTNENKKKKIVLIIIVLACLIILIGFYNKRRIVQSSDFVYEVGSLFEDEDQYSDVESGYVFTNYEDYKAKMNSDNLTKKDFEKNNYVVVSYGVDSCSESDVTPTGYTIDGNNITVTVKYRASCGSCASYRVIYLLKVDKSLIQVNIEMNYKAVNHVRCGEAVAYKPMIYLYPETKTDITVKLGNPELLTTTYPKYEGEWKVTADEDGNLIDKNGKEYYGLYWEGKSTIEVKFDDGFVVSKKDLIPFLEEKLTILGLNSHERNEFIVYWLPKLESNDYNLIRFETMENINKQMPLQINPKPDTVIRVFMEYKSTTKNKKVNEEKLTAVERKGYTVVEWGGTEVLK